MSRLSYVNKVDNRQWEWITEKAFSIKSKPVQFQWERQRKKSKT